MGEIKKLNQPGALLAFFALLSLSACTQKLKLPVNSELTIRNWRHFQWRWRKRGERIGRHHHSNFGIHRRQRLCDQRSHQYADRHHDRLKRKRDLC